MITSLRGTLISKTPVEVTVDVQGVGYGVSIPLSTYERLGNAKSEVTLLTYLHVREDTLQLYGFATEEERSLFKLLMSVTGIGPKMAQGILSGIAAPDLKSYLASGNLNALIAIPGVGRKLAERMVVELRDKISKLDSAGTAVPGATDSQSRIRSEAMLALTSLGYNRVVAEKALRAALEEAEGKDVSLEALIKLALRNASK